MIVIAENLNTRNKAYMESLSKRDAKAVSGLAAQLAASGADIINIQCSLDGSGDDDALPFVAGAVSGATDCGVCLDSRNINALKKAVKLGKKPPLVNFLSLNEPEDSLGLLSLVADTGASLILRASRATTPTTLEAKLQILEELLEEANAADIPNERLYADPSIVHIGKGIDQRHLVSSCDFIRVMKDMVEPPINTIGWISNVSTGLPSHLRRDVESSYLSYLCGAGLDAAMVNVLDPEMKKTVYLIKSFRGVKVFSPAEIS